MTSEEGTVPLLYPIHIERQGVKWVKDSAWIEPVYLTSNRYLHQKLGEMTLQIEFEYLAKRMIKYKQALNLATL
ncbi:hypothetical protein QTL97_08395 [Sporosarcina thermotolerans]|uniref:Uncharacterized protein n=2 Tax=Sporosarcina thermotolerans TaxID=633404 RepID=A0AAW9ACT6_9BACL|nr:hypothetical protein [Sporosarcina thermotolerans]MDW0116951.1 hypothetical protein [Sporosarcina thermotolerans]